nr:MULTISPECIES: peptidoglycan-binding protein [unclassified Lysobacter]
MPELRIAALSPQQRDAQEQIIREANRQGVSNDEVQQVAVAAAAAPIYADGTPPVLEAEAIRVVTDPEPPSIPKAVESAPSLPQSPVAVAEVAEPEPQPPIPKVASQAPVEPEKPEVLATKPPSLDAAAPPPATAPDVRVEAPVPPAPQIASPAAADTVHAPNDGTLRRGDTGQEVELLQFRLQRIGYRGPEEAPIPERGHFDAATEHAVRQLQRDHGLPDTGLVDPDTVQALAVAQQAKIESQKTAKADVEPSTLEQRSAQAEPALAARDERRVAPATEALSTPSPDARANEAAADRVEPSTAPDETHSNTRGPQYAPSEEAADKTAPERAAETADLSRLSPADQKMFAKIRGNVSADVPDETVAAAMLAAKRNGIADAESIGPVGVANGKLWVGAHTPGFHTGVSATGPAPSMQDTLRETQSFNQQLAQEAPQRGPDDPSQGPRR